MKISEEKVMRARDSLEIIFPNNMSRRAARLFIDWLKSKNDLGPYYATKTAVSKFADTLSEGIRDDGGILVKYSRVSFYGTIIKTLIEGGFLQKNLAIWDSHSSRTLFIYAPFIFNIPQEPPSLGFYKLAYYIAKKWNRLFLFEGST